MAIVLLGTLDTKGREVAFLAERLAEHGRPALVVDVGVFEPQGVVPDVGRHEVIAATGAAPEELLRRPRGEIMAVMGRGAGAILSRLAAEGRVEGALAVGGNQGTAVACEALRRLPLGVPKVVVSTVASGDVRPFVGTTDIAMLFSVADLLGGANAVVEPVLRNAAAAVAGMAAARAKTPAAIAGRVIAVTALGNTHGAVTRALSVLRAAGWEPVAFHASGAGGSAMERLVAQGRVAAVLDLTPHELTEEVVGAGWYRPVEPGRLTAAGAAGLPQIVAPGGMEYLCFGPRQSIPAAFRRRRVWEHNAACAHVPASRRELAAVGRTLAERLNRAKGPVAVVVPLRGWSVYGAPGGPLHNAAAQAALVRALTAGLRPDIPIHRLPMHVNDPAFADRCCALLLEMLGGAGAGWRARATA